MGLISRVSSRTYRASHLIHIAENKNGVSIVCYASCYAWYQADKQQIHHQHLWTMVEPYALDEYPNVLERTITVLKKYPAESEYAKMMTAFSEDQLQKVNAAEDVDAYERVEGRQIEEALQQARAELQLATDMLQYNIWEPLVEAAPEGQWKWP